MSEPQRPRPTCCKFHVQEYEIETLKAQIVQLQASVAPAPQEAEPLLDFVVELAGEPCRYGDNCPIFGSNHGRCLHCKARGALDRHNAARLTAEASAAPLCEKHGTPQAQHYHCEACVAEIHRTVLAETLVELKAEEASAAAQEEESPQKPPNGPIGQQSPRCSKHDRLLTHLWQCTRCADEGAAQRRAADSRLRDLISIWRQEALAGDTEEEVFKSECADELEATIAASAGAAPQEEQ